MLHQIKAPQFYPNFLKLLSLVMHCSISEVEFECVWTLMYIQWAFIELVIPIG